MANGSPLVGWSGRGRSRLWHKRDIITPKIITSKSATSG